jgi:hypothetical protein
VTPSNISLVHETITPEARGQYLGSKQCVRCHPAQARQLKSAHARTLAPVDPAIHGKYFRIPSRLTDPLEELSFHTLVKDGRCVLQASGEAGPQEAPADYVFGSGSVAYTYVSRSGDRSTQLRLSHYTRDGRWEFTPGMRLGGRANTPTGEVLTAAQERACFGCHSTALVRSGERLELERSILGIECEACHGPGQRHVAAVEHGQSDLQMPRLSSMRKQVSMQVCGQCHRAPGDVDMHAPGMAAQLPRLQAVALSRSACFTKGGVTCVSCHEPHGSARDTSRTEYNARCLSCHGPAKTLVCPVKPRGDCVSCHMPAQDVGMPTSPRFRNHWIRVWPASAAAGGGKAASLRLQQKSASIPEGDYNPTIATAAHGSAGNR